MANSIIKKNEKSVESSSSARKSDSSVTLAGRTNDWVVVASQWQLIRWRFTQHKVAMAAGIFLLFMYMLAIFPQFFAPYASDDRNFRLAYMPPQSIHFISEDGFSLRPFVYGVKKKVDFVTTRTIFSEDRTKIYPLQFFVSGEKTYKLLWLFETDIRLFGVDKKATIHLMGTDSIGRDVFSQIILTLPL